MSAYTWGLVVVALVAYVLGVVRVDRLPSKLLARVGVFPLTLRRRCSIEELSSESFESNAHRRVWARLIRRGEDEGRVLASAPLRLLAKHLYLHGAVAAPFENVSPEVLLHPGDVVVLELGGFHPIQDPSRLWTLRAIGGAA